LSQTDSKAKIADGRTDLPGYQAFVDGATLKGSQENFRHIDPDEVEDKPQIYKLMIGGITPRPIAFCSTISPTGVKGLAPFSYFSPMGFRPPMVSSQQNRIRAGRLICLHQLMVHFSCSKPLVDGEGKHKDTLNNIKATKEFVVNMISEPFVEASK
jgi:flavin reductase (DIM6/NTAB) family NADH-FMN oxidoreductase RutF